MKWCVVGAGAIGGVIGARLQLAGAEVTLIARGQHLAEIQRTGLRLVDGDGERALGIPAHANVAAAGLRDGDVVLLATKSQDTGEALARVAGQAPPGVHIVCAQNGVDNERQALRLFESVFGMAVSLLGSYLEPGQVIAHAAPVVGTLQLGRYPATAVADPIAVQLAEILGGAGFLTKAWPDVSQYKRSKLLVNLAGGVEAICGPASRGGELADRVVREGRACFEAAGLSLPDKDDAVPLASGSTVVVPRGGNSTWQSLQRGAGSIETDYLNGEIVLLGRLYGVPTPANVLIQQEVRALSGTGPAPATVSETELLSRLG